MNLVVGATGLLGGLIVNKLMARGKPARAIVFGIALTPAEAVLRKALASRLPKSEGTR